MSTVSSSDLRTKEAGETVNVLVDFFELLDRDSAVNETISSVSSVTGSPSGLTIAGGAVTTVVRKINGKLVPAGKAISFTVSGGSNGTSYVLTCTVVTSGGQTRVRKLNLDVSSS